MKQVKQKEADAFHTVNFFLKSLLSKMRKDDCSGTAAEMAYHFMLSFFPALIFLLSLLSLFAHQGNLLSLLVELLSDLIPGLSKSQNKLLYDTINAIIQGGSGQLALISFLTALYTSSNGAIVIIKGVSQAYGIQPGNISFFRSQLLAILLVLSFGFILVAASNLIFISSHLLQYLKFSFQWWGLNLYLVECLRWGLATVGMICFSALVYAMTPWSSHMPMLRYRQCLPGGIAFVTLWIGFSVLFRLYVENFAQYNRVYGLLGGVVIFLTWLYLTSLAVLIGGEVDGLLLEKKRISK